MDAVNIHDAKTHFSKLIERVTYGEEITIARSGMPVAKLVPLPPKVERRIPGSGRGIFHAGPDFDAPLPEDVLHAFSS